IPVWRNLPATSRTPARAAGRSRLPLTKRCRCPFSPPRCTNASAHAARRIIRTKSFRRCDSTLADTWRKLKSEDAIMNFERALAFAREDYVEEAWRIVDPVLKAGTPVYK